MHKRNKQKTYTESISKIIQIYVIYIKQLYQRFAIFVRNNLLCGGFISDIIQEEKFALLEGQNNPLKERYGMKFRPAVLIVLSALLCAVVAFSGLYRPISSSAAAYTKFSKVKLNIFDTEISLIGFTEKEEDFENSAAEVFSLLDRLDAVFDAYNGYNDLHNLYYVNRHAAKEPVVIPDELFDLISWCKNQWYLGRRTTNIAMGAVLSIWHDYRTAGIKNPDEAALPPMELLEAASSHTDFENVVLNSEKHTVFFSDPELTLDIGAVAKGYAADAACHLLSQSMPSFLLSLGGNVYAGKAPLDGRQNWAVGVQDPRAKSLGQVNGGSDILDIVDVTEQSVVTSGDYWRYYIVDGQRYHHIIDPDTLMPSRQMQSVTVVCQSSLLADFMSTTLFVQFYEDGCQLVESMDGVEAMWVLEDGTIKYSSGMARFLRSQK